MSIYGLIAERVKESRLFPLTHSLGFPIVRRIIVSEEVNELVSGPWATPEWKTRCFSLLADFDRVLDGSPIYVALPRKDKPYERKPRAQLRLLHPKFDEIWEIRSVDDDPSLRIFGRFAGPDYFVALGWAKRDELYQPASPQWRYARVACKAEWVKLLYPYPAFSGQSIHDYITTDAIPC